MQITLCKLSARENCCHYEMLGGGTVLHNEMEGAVSPDILHVVELHLTPT